MVGPAERRALVEWMVAEKHISQRKACRWVGLSRNAIKTLVSLKEKDKVLQERIKQLAKRYTNTGGC